MTARKKIQANLLNLVNEMHIEKYHIGQEASALQDIGEISSYWMSRHIEGEEVNGWYEFGDVEFHCERNKLGAMTIKAIKVVPGRERRLTERELTGGGIFSFDSEGIYSGQPIGAVLPKLVKFGIRLERKFGNDETQVYSIGKYGTAIFCRDEETGEIFFDSFEATSR